MPSQVSIVATSGTWRVVLQGVSLFENVGVSADALKQNGNARRRTSFFSDTPEPRECDAATTGAESRLMP